MPKFRLLGIILFLAVLKVAAQDHDALSPRELILAIQKSKPDTNRISLELKLGSYYLNKPLYEPIKPHEGEHNRNSAINLFNQAKQLSIKLHETDWEYNAVDRIAYYYECVDSAERSKQSFRQIIAYYHQKGNLGKEAHAWQLLAEACLIIGKFNDNVPERISDYQHARSLYLQNHEPTNAAGILIDIGMLRRTNEPGAPGAKEIQQGLAEYKALGYKQLQNTYMVLVQLEYEKGNYYRAMDYCLQGIKSIIPGENIRNSANFYMTAARCDYAVKKYKEAEDWARKAIAIDGGYPDDKYFLVETLLAQNRTEEALGVVNEIAKAKFSHSFLDTLKQYKCLALYYVKKNEAGLAVRYYIKTLELAKKSIGGRFNELYITCDNGIAQVYLNANQPAKAEKYINDVALMSRYAGTYLDPRFLVDFYDNSYKYDVATGKYQAAVKNLERHDRLQDSLFTVDKNNKMAELDIQYQTAQKEQSIKDLHTQATVQQATVEKANMQRNITIGGIVFMTLVSGLFYKNYKQKQRANNIITHKNELLQHLLTEKEWLLKEVHHRVKNNLHTVISLLESQARYLENDALKAIENSQHRIYAMSLLHQKLYQADDIKTIDMASYIPELVESLQESFGNTGQIQFKLNIDKINLALSHAIPLGLIINEAVTNSIKYAFPGNRKGEISISMVNVANNIKLELADNGIGIPHIALEDEPESLGLRLMKGLSEDIDADIRFVVNNGTRISIIFKPDTLHDPEHILKPTEAKEVMV